MPIKQQTLRRSPRVAVAIVVALLFLRGDRLPAEDWPHWGGARRDRTTQDVSGFKDGKWNLQTLWDGEVGEGCSSPLVVGNSAYFFGNVNGQETLRSLVADSGELQWEVAYPAPQYGRFHDGDEGFYSGPSGTPDYDPATGTICTLGIDGDLCCRDAASQGALIWKRNLYEDFEVPKRPRLGRTGLRDYGYTTSPLILGSQVIVEVGSPERGNLIAFDLGTGKPLWASASKRHAGHSGGLVPLEIDSIPCVATLTLAHLVVTRIDPPHAGETMTEFEWITPFGNNIPTPITIDQDLFVTTGAGGKFRCARWRLGQQKAEQQWIQEVGASVSSPVFHQGRFYFGFQQLNCLDATSGNILWQGGDVGAPCSLVLTQDERLIVWSKNGRLSLVSATEAKQFEELASREVFEYDDAWPQIVVANQKILAKDRRGRIMCLRKGP